MAQVAKRVVASSRGRQDLVHSGWGDESKLEEELVNPLYDTELYRKYSERTRSNLVSIRFLEVAILPTLRAVKETQTGDIKCVHHQHLKLITRYIYVHQLLGAWDRLQPVTAMQGEGDGLNFV